MSDDVAIEIAALRLMTRGAYDLQKLRVQVGLRLVANFRAKLHEEEPEGKDEDEEKEDELSEEALKLIVQLRASYRRLTDGVARNRTLPAKEGFHGDELISTFTELTLVDQYIRLEAQEALHFGQMGSVLDRIPLYTTYLRDIRGIGPAMAAVLISYLKPELADHISSYWRYAGLDVGPDGLGRSRRAEHLVEYEYTDKNGNLKTRMGVTYNPFLKAKLMGVLAGSFHRSKNVKWVLVYNNYKHRISTDPMKEKVTLAEYKRRHKAEEPTEHIWPPGRIHNASNRYMIKMFLQELWTYWRELEGLSVTPSYHEAIQGQAHTPSTDERRASLQ